MSVIYAWWCNDCGHTHHTRTDECEKCQSTDIYHGAAYGQVEYDDAQQEARLAEIRGEVVDQIIEAAVIELPPVEAGWFTKRQAG